MYLCRIWRHIIYALIFHGMSTGFYRNNQDILYHCIIYAYSKETPAKQTKEKEGRKR